MGYRMRTGFRTGIKRCCCPTNVCWSTAIWSPLGSRKMHGLSRKELFDTPTVSFFSLAELRHRVLSGTGVDLFPGYRRVAGTTGSVNPDGTGTKDERHLHLGGLMESIGRRTQSKIGRDSGWSPLSLPPVRGEKGV